MTKLFRSGSKLLRVAPGVTLRTSTDATGGIVALTVTNRKNAAVTGGIVRFGLGLAAGVLTAGKTIAVFDGATPLDVQIDNAVTLPDPQGTKFVCVTVANFDIGALATKKFMIRAVDGSPATGTDITAADLLATRFGLRDTIVIDGVTYGAGARVALAGGSTPGLTNDYLAGKFMGGGGLVTCFKAMMPYRAAGVPHLSGKGMRCEFHVYAYKRQRGAVSPSNPIVHVEVDRDPYLGFLEATAGDANPVVYSQLTEISDDLSLGAPIAYTTAKREFTGVEENWPNTDVTGLGDIVLSAFDFAQASLRTATLQSGTWPAGTGGVISDGTGHFMISRVLDATRVEGSVVKAFGSATLPAGTWGLYGVRHSFGQRNPRRYQTSTFDFAVCLGDEPSALAPTNRATQAYLSAAGLVSSQMNTAIDHSDGITKLNACVRPFSHTSAFGATDGGKYQIGEFGIKMDNPGGRPDIGPAPECVVEGIAVMTDEGRRRIFDNSVLLHYLNDAGGMSGDTGVTTNFASGVDYRSSGVVGTLVQPASSINTSPIIWGFSHQPNLGYEAYLLTGDLKWIEALHRHILRQTWTCDPNYYGSQMIRVMGGVVVRSTLLGEAAVTSADKVTDVTLSGPKYYFGGPQARGMAWTLNQVAKAAFITPDVVDPKVLGMSQAHLRQYFINNIFAAKRCGPDNTDAGGNLYTAGGIHWAGYNGTGALGSFQWAPWQHNMIIWVLGIMLDLGLDTLTTHLRTVFDWFASGPINMATAPSAVPDWLVFSYSVPLKMHETGAVTKTVLENYTASSQIIRRGVAPGGSDNNQPYNSNRLAGTSAQTVTFDLTDPANVLVTFPTPLFTVSAGGFYITAATDPETAWGGWVQAYNSSADNATGIGYGKIKSLIAPNQVVVDTTGHDYAMPFPAAEVQADRVRVPPPAPVDKLPDGTDTGHSYDLYYLQYFFIAMSYAAYYGTPGGAAAASYARSHVKMPAQSAFYGRHQLAARLLAA